MYQNNGKGKFTDVTQQAGVGDSSYGVGCCVGDYNNDGYLDLYVTNYGDNILYKNNGNGTFVDVTDQANVGDSRWGTGCSFADYDNDGDQDLYLANDTDQNILYRNNGDATFTNTNNADQRSHTGDIRGGMGITWGDYDNDEDLDLFVTNWLDENNVLYRNNGDGTFTDVSARSKVFESGLGKTCWGTEFFDYDPNLHS